MDLITHELAKYKRLNEEYAQKLDTIETEVTLLNQLVTKEQDFSQQLYDFLVSNHNHLKANGSQSLPLQSALTANQKLFADMTHVISNKDEVKTLRKALDDWRLDNHRWMAVNQTKAKANDVHVLDDIEETADAGEEGSDNTGFMVTADIPVVEIIDSPQKEAFKVPVPAVPVQLEVIPKPEPMSDGEDEETDTASERESPVKMRSATAASESAGKPFMFVSQYLSQNMSFSHLLGTNSQGVVDKKPAVSDDKQHSIAIDLNSDSDEAPDPQTSGKSIFNDGVIDLTPPPDRQSASKAKICTMVKTKKKVVKKIVKKSVKPRLSNGNQMIKKMVKTKKKVVKKIVKKSVKPKLSNGNQSKTKSDPALKTTLVPTTNPYQCQLCAHGFKDKRHLSNHMMSHNVVQIRLSAKSSQKSDSKSGYRVRGSGDIICPECETRFQGYGLLMKHIKRIHGLAKHERYRRQYLKQKAFLDNNPNASIIKTPIKTPIKTAAVGAAIETLAVDTVIRSKRCPDCEKSYITDKVLMEHIRKIHGLEKVREYRQTLNSSVSSNDSKTVTESQVNTNSKLNQIAKKLLSPKRTNKTQKAVPKPQKLGPKSQKLLPKSLKGIITPKALKVIETPNVSNESTLSPDKVWNCDYNSCLRSYNSKSNLKRHQMEIHKRLSKALFYKTSRHETNIKYFIPKSATNETMIAHTANTSAINLNASNSKQKSPPLPGDKTFVCNIKNCCNSYQTISGLYKHKKLKHKSKIPFSSMAATMRKKQSAIGLSNMSPRIKAAVRVKTDSEVNKSAEELEEDVEYECTYPNCQFQATGRKAVVQHFTTHFPGVDKPFKCVITDCSFAGKALFNLKNHVLSHHSEQQFIKAMDATDYGTLVT
ncbi:unnamed protein product, partial [Oppiella nova]